MHLRLSECWSGWVQRILNGKVIVALQRFTTPRLNGRVDGDP